MAMMVALTCVCSIISIPLSFTPVPVTLSVFAVLMTGALLKPRYAATVQIVYILLGLVGIPVFAGFTSGPGVAMGPTGGYLIAYPLMALTVSLFASKKANYQGAWLAGGMIAALLICYAFGTAWLATVVKISFTAALGIGVVPYLIPDGAKLVLAFSISAVLKHQMEKIFSRQGIKEA